MLYSTEITPTLIACYKAATGGMGLISKTAVLSRNYAHSLSLFCLRLRPDIQ